MIFTEPSNTVVDLNRRVLKEYWKDWINNTNNSKRIKNARLEMYKTKYWLWREYLFPNDEEIDKVCGEYYKEKNLDKRNF